MRNVIMKRGTPHNYTLLPTQLQATNYWPTIGAVSGVAGLFGLISIALGVVLCQRRSKSNIGGSVSKGSSVGAAAATPATVTVELAQAESATPEAPQVEAAAPRAASSESAAAP